MVQVHGEEGNLRGNVAVAEAVIELDAVIDADLRGKADMGGVEVAVAVLYPALSHPPAEQAGFIPDKLLGIYFNTLVLPADLMLDVMLRKKTATADQIKRVAQKVARFHRQAQSGVEIASLGGLDTVIFNTLVLLLADAGAEVFARLRKVLLRIENDGVQPSQ
jgi:hypothetical protein